MACHYNIVRNKMGQPTLQIGSVKKETAYTWQNRYWN